MKLASPEAMRFERTDEPELESEKEPTAREAVYEITRDLRRRYPQMDPMFRELIRAIEILADESDEHREQLSKIN